MNKNVSRTAGFVMAIVLTICTYFPGRATSQTALMPARTINIAHFFKPPNMDAATAAKTFGSIILTNGDQTYRSKLMSSGFTSTVTEYFRADAIQNPGSCTASPLNNQVAYKAGDFCAISRDHPDWFLLDSYGKRITVTSGGSYYRMDPANAGWRNFFLTRVVESQKLHGWTGLFLDNVEGGLGKFYGPKPVKYPDHARYQAAVAGFLNYLYVNYSQKYSRPIIGNIVARADDPVWFTYLKYMSGAMQERFAVAWDETSYLSASRWLKDLEMMEKTQNEGKSVILIAPGNQTDTARQSFAFASYLLMSKGKAAFRYSTDDAYRDAWLYSNYSVKLGSPKGARYLQGSVWRRDFAYGYVTVDPVAHKAVIKVTTTTNSTNTLSDAEVTLTPPAQLTATVTAPAEIPTKTVYNDNDPAFQYSGTWEVVSNDQSVDGSFKLTKERNASVTLPFNGETFSVTYKSGPLFGRMEVYVDGELMDTIDQRTAEAQFQNQWHFIGRLTNGAHELKLVFSGPADTRASLDAVTIP